ncbi:MAG: metal ABC transporter substrate-binding protein [Chloroflexota bacterium]|nr:metal ABC transporter substrate-binding protein [Chloroflexota bacterium]MDE2941719.1 metal ABC transporter substrate-binding protein [Chloroflexota bacterium]MDE3267169.1 metal ABC transporter substrate-binding protein [Chloroflexota bacterium]
MVQLPLILRLRYAPLGRLVRAWSLVVALAAVAIFGACAGEDPTPTTAPTATTAPTPTAAPTATPEPPPLQVVTTTNIMADWVENIGGGHVEVTSLLGEGADPHTYQPGARDVTAIADADLVLSVGLGLEGAWLVELLQNAARDASTVIDFDETIDPIEFGETHIEDVHLLEELSHVVHEVEEGEISAEEGLAEIKAAIEAFEAAEEDHHEEGEQGEEEEEDHEEGEEKEGEEEEHHDEEGEEISAMVLELITEVEEGHMDAEEAIEEIEHLTEEGEGEHEGHGHGIFDPHFWFDPLRVKVAVDDIAARLSELDPDNASVYFENASEYGKKLDELHAWTLEQVAVVPQERRLLVTSHDSFGYFADLYGFEVVGVVLSITTDVEPSAEHLVELVHEVEELGVPAVFGETTVSERLAQTVADESGATLVRLYSGSLGAGGSGADTYLDMVRTNVDRIVNALK